MKGKLRQELDEYVLKSGGVPILPPQKRCFLTMFELLKDAEKYDNENEIEIRNATLTTLREYIERVIAKGKTSTVLERLTNEEIIPNRDDNTYLK